MEKRTILAFILSFLVFIIWAQFFIPKTNIPVNEAPKIEEKAVQVIKDESADLPAATPEHLLNNTDKEVLSNSVAEKIITIETPLYKATFTNKGPAITGFQLKKYRDSIDPGSPYFEIFKENEQVKNHVSFLYNNPQIKEGSDLFFTADKENINLLQGQKMETLQFRYTSPEGITIEQSFSFSPDKYDIGVNVKVSNNSVNVATGNIKSVISNLHAQRKDKYYSFTGTAVFADNDLKQFKPKDLEDEEDTDITGSIAWFSYEDEYFITAVAPEEKKGARYIGTMQKTGVITATHFSESVEILPSAEILKNYTLFLGPKEIKTLKKFGNNLDSAIDFGFFDVIAKPLHHVLVYFNKYLKNFGFSIILVTIIIKIIFWPLTHKSQKSMKEMQKLQPLMAKIKEKYKDNREMMNKELMGLYRTYKVNPMSGCLPMLIQIPVFIALYSVLSSAIELRHEPFAFWIKDLSTPDRLFSLPFGIPFMEPPYGIPVLTLLMGLSMFIQQKMQPMVGDPAQAKIMMFMPIMFTVMFINFPSGLVLYWLTQNILSIGQQYYINKKPV
ncbi:MAG: membrane protein insertase YidC [Deltaproteobacteria bacterium]|nr:membrane protein insertase YidC [Deltaproteobacteria bacterium]